MKQTAVLLLLLSCGTPPSMPDAGSGCPTTLTVGTVNDADGGFLPIVDGQELTVHAGPQGGFHVFVGVEVSGLPRTGLLSWRLSSQGGLELAARTLDVSTVLLEDRACGWARPRDVLPFTRNEDVTTFRGVPVTLEVELGDGGVRRQRSVVPR